MKLEEGYSTLLIVKELGIASHSRVEAWVRKYKEAGETGLEDMRGRAASGRPRKKPLTREQELEKRIRRLEMENAALKKLRELIDSGDPWQTAHLRLQAGYHRHP